LAWVDQFAPPAADIAAWPPLPTTPHASEPSLGAPAGLVPPLPGAAATAAPPGVVAPPMARGAACSWHLPVVAGAPALYIAPSLYGASTTFGISAPSRATSALPAAGLLRHSTSAPPCSCRCALAILQQLTARTHRDAPSWPADGHVRWHRFPVLDSTHPAYAYQMDPSSAGTGSQCPRAGTPCWHSRQRLDCRLGGFLPHHT
jgi:hypothetical protein